MSAGQMAGQKRRGAARAAMVRLAGLVGFALLGALGFGFVRFVHHLEPRETPVPRHADGIVALTGGAERVTDAVSLLLRGDGDRLLISGVNPSTSAEELVRAVPGAQPLIACCIELGYKAANTVGNARETRAWVARHNIRSLVVVTSNYHMPRALAELGDAAPGVDLLPYPVVSDRAEHGDWWADPGRLRLVWTEYLKYLVVLARTRVVPAAPYGGVARPSLGATHLPQAEPCSFCARSSSTSSSTSS